MKTSKKKLQKDHQTEISKNDITDLKTELFTNNNEEYNEEDLITLHKKLQEAKQQRKRVEMDAKLLEHRVVLLQNQEKIVKQSNKIGYKTIPNHKNKS